jgi:hypothetical protein
MVNRKLALRQADRLCRIECELSDILDLVASFDCGLDFPERDLDTAIESVRKAASKLASEEINNKQVSSSCYSSFKFKKGR